MSCLQTWTLTRVCHSSGVPEKPVGTLERKASLPITHLTFGVSWEVEPPYGAFSTSIKSWEYLNRDVVFHYGRVHQLGVYNFPKCVHKGNVKARVEVERGFWNSLDERFALQCEEQSWNLKHSCKCQVGTEILLWCPFLKGGGGMTRSWTTTLAGGGATAGSLSRFASMNRRWKVTENSSWCYSGLPYTPLHTDETTQVKFPQEGIPTACACVHTGMQINYI